MRIILVIPIVASLFCRAQDSIPKLKLRLFDVNLGLNFIPTHPAKPEVPYISKFTTHQEYVSETFTRGYSDSLKLGTGFREWFAPSFCSEVALTASFKLQHLRPKLLQRLKPRIGLYFGAQRFFDRHTSTIGYRSRTTIDSLYFVKPGYDAIPVDSVYEGYINYSYKSRHIYFELGTNIDVIILRRFIFYTGFVYGMAYGYENYFTVNKSEWYYIEKDPNTYYYDRTGDMVDIHKTFAEPNSISHRFIVPIGAQHRFAVKHKFSVSFFAEARLGSEIYKIQNKRVTSFQLSGVNFGVRFNFMYHK
jgi:hypothetical protein